MDASLGISVAVITSGSLIDRDNVRRDLRKIQLVSLKIDTAN